MFRFGDKKTKDELKFINYLGKIRGKDIYLAKKYLDLGLEAHEPSVEIMEDIVSPVWTTKKHYQNHKQKKEYEDITKLDKHYCTESNMPRVVASSIGVRGHHDYLSRRDVAFSPYLYGADITQANWVKDWWIKNGGISKWRVCMLDTEVNIENPESENITHMSISMDNQSFLGVMRERFDGHGYANDEEIKADIARNYKEYVPNGVELWNSKFREIVLFDTHRDMLETVFDKIHSWQPDILAIWNIDYDIPKIEKEYLRCGGNMASLYCDPAVPKEYATYEYVKGKNLTITILDDGTKKSKTKKWYEIMHVVKCSAGFLVVDAATIFHYIRSQEPVIEGGMGLNNVLQTILKIGKVKDDSPLSGAAWHISTSNKKPAFYSCYGMFDTDSMNLNDNKTQDLELTAASQIGASQFSTFASLPKRLHVAFHFAILPDGFVVGTASPTIQKDSVLGTGGGWIVTVPAYRKTLNNFNIVDDNPNARTTHFGMVYDLDIVSAYPFATVAANVSSLTTMTELIRINGMGKQDFLKNNINIIINKCNALTYGVNMFKNPTIKDLYNLDIKKELELIY